jgi:lipoyl(octanoyl) transferase
VEERFTARAAEVWESDVSEVPPELRTISVVVTRGDGSVLLLKRSAQRGGFWQIVTGRIEPGENPLGAAAREVLEETGFSPRLDQLRDLHYQHSFMLDSIFARETAFAVRAQAEPKLSDEHVEYRWCTPQEAAALVPYAGLRRAIQLAVADMSGR